MLRREIWFCALKKHTEGIHQGVKSNFVRGNLMPTLFYNDWRKLIIANNIPVSATQELFNRIFIIHVSWYTSTSPFCNISEINSISSSCRLSSRLPAQQFILKTNTFSEQMARNVGKQLQYVPNSRTGAWRLAKKNLIMCTIIWEQIIMIIKKEENVYYQGGDVLFSSPIRRIAPLLFRNIISDNSFSHFECFVCFWTFSLVAVIISKHDMQT